MARRNLQIPILHTSFDLPPGGGCFFHAGRRDIDSRDEPVMTVVFNDRAIDIKGNNDVIKAGLEHIRKA